MPVVFLPSGTCVGSALWGRVWHWGDIVFFILHLCVVKAPFLAAGTSQAHIK